MATHIIDGIEKEPEENKSKAVDFSDWLNQNETINDAKVYIYETSPKKINTFDLSNIRYVDITLYDKDHQQIESQSEWEMDDKWENLIFFIEGPFPPNEVTQDMLVSDITGNNDPNYWIKRVDNKKYRIIIQNGEITKSYRGVFKVTTNANRVEKLHFPIDITEVQKV